MTVPFSGSHRIAATVAALHLVGALLTAWYVSVASASSGQAGLVWVFWMLVDLPISFLAYTLSDVGFLFTHALLGSLWWYFLVMVVTSFVKRRGIRGESNE